MCWILEPNQSEVSPLGFAWVGEHTLWDNEGCFQASALTTECRNCGLLITQDFDSFPELFFIS